VRTPASCTVLIGSPDLLPALKERTNESGELLTFTDAEALRALDVIAKRRPQVVALERLFAATPRGAALINRIKADPALEQSEIRVISHNSDYTRVSARQRPPAATGGDDRKATATVVSSAPQSLDRRGTRRAPRFKVAGTFGALLDGNPATVIDLSTIGAQVVSSAVLRPNQVVRMGLSDDHDHVRFNAAVAWASFEIPPNSGPRYRAGIKFVDADEGAVGGFCQRHKAS
jgi:hypothetical protein